MSEDAEDADPWQAEPLHVAVFREGGEVTVVLEGGLDWSGAERFRAYVMEALGKRPAVLTIDATTLTSVDSVGLAGVVRGPSRRDRRGRGVPGQRRIARLFGMLLRTPASTRCYPTSDAAVADRPPDGGSAWEPDSVGPGGRCPTG
jgi:hypothetical protein